MLLNNTTVEEEEDREEKEEKKEVLMKKFEYSTRNWWQQVGCHELHKPEAELKVQIPKGQFHQLYDLPSKNTSPPLCYSYLSSMMLLMRILQLLCFNSKPQSNLVLLRCQKHKT